MLRFPLTRVLRLLLLAGAAGAAFRGAWSGTAPLVAVAGLALWLAGLDLVEPVAEEVDHPSRREAYPTEEGSLYLRLLAVPLVLAVVLGLVTGGVAAAPGGGQLPVAVGLLAGVATALAAAVGALCNVVAGAPSQSDELGLIAPEVAGLKMVLRTAFPPALAVLGALPLLAVGADRDAGRALTTTAPPLWLALAGLVALVLGWVHQRQAIAEWWRQAMDAAGQGPARPPASDDAADDRADEHDDDEEDEHR